VLSKEEEHIVKGCCKSDRKSQKKLYDLFAKKMLVVALRYADGKQEAEDILQESFIKVFNYISSFRKDCPLENWIKKIVINTALNTNRSKLYLYPAVDVENTDLKNLLADDPYVISSLHYEQLLEIIHQLPTSYRTIFNLYAIEGYQHNEIAAMLDISEGTSKSQYARAKIFLQRVLKKYEENQEDTKSTFQKDKKVK